MCVVLARLLPALPLLASCNGSSAVGPQTMSSALYARQDSDSTTVWAPRLHLGARVGESAGVDMTYAVDAWTGASIDVVTSASKTPVEEVRTELSASSYYEFKNATISGGYRYSGENDYWSHGGVTNVTIDMADNNSTLGVAVFGSRDIVGRSGDPDFTRQQTSLGGRLSLSQVVNVNTVLQASWESTHLSGFLASPYRFVGLGGNGICGAIPGAPAANAFLCLPESHPHARTRNAATLSGRRALGSYASLGLTYRFYIDDWGILSNMLAPDLALLAGDHGTFKLLYRYYAQGEADFYRTSYGAASPALSFYTRDRKMSAMDTNHVGLEYVHEIEVGESGDKVLTAALRTGYTRFHYQAFLGLTTVNAYEGTFLLSLDFR